MKLTILTENNTLIDRYFVGEPGLSIFIEDEDIKLLFDVGYSAAFIKNAKKMNINLSDLDYIILSHGHNDHTWGLESLIKVYEENKLKTKINLITHPLTFNAKFYGEEEIGSKFREKEFSKYFEIKFKKEPFWITQRLVFLGEIPRKNFFEAKKPIGEVLINNTLQADYVLDDSALVYKSNEGLVIITGCSHSGICNIIEYAKEICQENKVIDIIGGFHLLNPSADVMQNTLTYLKLQRIMKLHPCHCTDLKSKIALSEISDLQEVGVSLELRY